MNPPLVVCFVVFRNCEPFIATCLGSIIAQTYDNFRCYVLDDASQDDGSRVAKEVVDSDFRFTRGWFATHTGKWQIVKQAEGQISEEDYVCFVDGDDWLEPGAFRHAVEALQGNAGAGFCLSRQRLVNEKGEPVRVFPEEVPPATLESLIASKQATHFAMYRGSDYLRLGGVRRHMLLAADFDLQLRLAADCGYVVVPNVDYNYRRHNAQVSRSQRAQQRAYVRKATEEALKHGN